MKTVADLTPPRRTPRATPPAVGSDGDALARQIYAAALAAAKSPPSATELEALAHRSWAASHAYLAAVGSADGAPE